MALVVMAIVWVVTAHEASATHGWPSERAEITAVKNAGGFLPCGRGGGAEQDITYRSLNPPDGLPKTFVDRKSCDGGSIGEVDTVVRVINGDGSVSVYVEPATSQVEALGITLLIGAGTFVVAYVGYLISRRWARSRRNRHRR